MPNQNGVIFRHPNNHKSKPRLKEELAENETNNDDEHRINQVDSSSSTSLFTSSSSSSSSSTSSNLVDSNNNLKTSKTSNEDESVVLSSLAVTENHHTIDNRHSDRMNNYDRRANENHRQLRIMIVTESFHPYTSGIARRFKEILQRLAKRGFLIHILTGCKVN